MAESKATGFWRYSKMAIGYAFIEFQVGRDMLLGTVIALITLGIQVREHLIPTADWQEHKEWWILSLVIPYIVVLGGHAIWRVCLAPWRFHQKMESEHAISLQAATQALTAADEKCRSLGEQLTALQEKTILERKHSKSLDWGGEWKLAEDGFRPYSKTHVKAQRQYESSTKRGTWTLAGEDVLARQDIEATCTRAGALLLVTPGLCDSISTEVRNHQNDMERWLEYMGEKHPLTDVLTLTSTDPNENYATQIGEIKGFAALSANECVKCAAAALKFKQLW